MPLIFFNKMRKVMNKITSMIVIIAGLLFISTQSCAAVTVSISDCTAVPDGTVTVPIIINDIEDYGTGTINIEYDTDVVRVVNAYASDDSSITVINIDNTTGTAMISAWNINGVTGNIIFANVVLQAVGSSGDSSSLDIIIKTLKNISYKEIETELNNGTFTISGSSGDTDQTATPASTSGSSSHKTPPLPDITGTVAESGSEAEQKETDLPDPVQVSDAPSDQVPLQDTSSQTPGFGVGMCLLVLIIYMINLNKSNKRR